MNLNIRLIVAVLMLCWFSTECKRVKRVVGGMEVECGVAPHVTSLRNSSSLQHLCGATILTPEWALTAAHCVLHDARQYLLQLNNYCSDSLPRAEVLEVIPHELYNKVSRAHDVAILRIRLNLDTLGDVSWLADDVLPNYSFGISGECTIYGYGAQDPMSDVTSEVLLAATVRLVSLDYCTEMLDPIAPKSNDGMMCAMGDGTDACQGDSGSPLVCNNVVEAICSYGQSCGAPGIPGVYTSMGAHIRWIREIVYNTIV